MIKITTQKQAEALTYSILTKRHGPKTCFVVHTPTTGLQLRVSKRAIGYWVEYRDRKKVRCLESLGPRSEFTLDEAGAAATRIRGLSRQSTGADVRALFEAYTPVHLAGTKKKGALQHPEKFLSAVRCHILPKLGDVELKKLTVVKIERALEEIRNGVGCEGNAKGGNEPARVCFHYLSKALAYGYRKGLLREDLTLRMSLDDTQIKPVQKRDRKLDWSEITEFLRVVDGSGIDARVKLHLQLCLLLGNRCGEYHKAEWSHVDWGQKLWHIPAANNKTGTSYDIPLDSVLPLFKRLYELTGPTGRLMGGVGRSHLLRLCNVYRRRASVCLLPWPCRGQDNDSRPAPHLRDPTGRDWVPAAYRKCHPCA